jgi:hypothetical protein
MPIRLLAEDAIGRPEARDIVRTVDRRCSWFAAAFLQREEGL